MVQFGIGIRRTKGTVVLRVFISDVLSCLAVQLSTAWHAHAAFVQARFTSVTSGQTALHHAQKTELHWFVLSFSHQLNELLWICGIASAAGPGTWISAVACAVVPAESRECTVAFAGLAQMHVSFFVRAFVVVVTIAVM
jgi:hypothetical protein